MSLRMHEGYHPVRSRVGWQLWATERLMDAARNYLFPVYASLLTALIVIAVGYALDTGWFARNRHDSARAAPLDTVGGRLSAPGDPSSILAPGS